MGFTKEETVAVDKLLEAFLEIKSLSQASQDVLEDVVARMESKTFHKREYNSEWTKLVV